jgi:hypothetical protein
MEEISERIPVTRSSGEGISHNHHKDAKAQRRLKSEGKKRQILLFLGVFAPLW